ncbi:LysE family translocator [Aridibaculum aurantiacum]|uniref:LysE family translocator n=1 Tax=Aridibaculum aurantiacum TaxID=2810307 RepID=UPI001A964F39|nr:LysE family transporter [Aridibaculum aurantiacum]
MIAALLKGLALGLMLSISVGPVIFSILKQSINNGLKGGFAFIIGVSASDITLVIASNLFTELFGSLLDYKLAIGLGGSALLIALGIYVTFFKKIAVNESGMQVIQISTHDYIKIFLAGYFMNTLNPSVIGFWLLTSTSLLVQSFNYRLVVYATCLVVVAAFDIAKVLLAGRIRQKLTPHNIHIINRISGLILIGFGVALTWGILAYGDRIE